MLTLSVLWGSVFASLPLSLAAAGDGSLLFIEAPFCEIAASLMAGPPALLPGATKTENLCVRWSSNDVFNIKNRLADLSRPLLADSQVLQNA